MSSASAWCARACTSRSQSDLPKPVEALHTIADPIDKDVASVLQTELSRYEVNGRQAGGLGSVNIVMAGTEIKQLGSDIRIMQATANQEIVSEPGSPEIKSDNLDALLALYTRLAIDDERGRKLLAHLEETPAIAAALPFTVGYLVDKLRRTVTPKMALQSIDLTENELMP